MLSPRRILAGQKGLRDYAWNPSEAVSFPGGLECSKKLSIATTMAFVATSVYAGVKVEKTEYKGWSNC